MAPEESIVRGAADPARTDGLEPVAPHDAVWLQDSPTNLMVINSIFTVDHMPVETLREVWHERVMSEPRYDRFKKRVVRRDGAWWWQTVDDFDLAEHIFEIDEPIRDRDELQSYIGRQAALRLPDHRPPWRMMMVREFGDGGTAIITRVHHVMGDGMALVPVLFQIMDLDGLSVEEVQAKQVKTRGTVGKPWKLALRAALSAPGLLVSRALRPPDRTPFHGPELTGTKRVAWTSGIPLERVKAIKNRSGATVNDVLLTVVAGAFRRYAAKHPQEHVERVRVSMPVDVRPRHEKPKMENRFAAVFVELPAGIVDARERLAVIKERMDALKKSVDPLIYYGAATVMLKTLPKALSRKIIDFYASKCTAVLSNVPGPRETLSICGRTVRAMLFWVPQRADIGLGISILSFSGEVRVGVFADTAILTDPADLVHEIEAELDHVDSVL